MTHNFERGHWLRESAIGLSIGVLYGVTNVSVGHPFDTIKTKMQAQAGFESKGMVNTIATTLKKDGVIGLYRGCVPPLWGSAVFRSTQFAVFEGVYTYLDVPIGTTEIPLTGGLQTRVLAGGVIASTARALIECPLEFAKVRGQTNQSWTFRFLYTGLGVTWCRTVGLMTTYFILIDSGRRHMPELFNGGFWGPFLASGGAATAGWWVVWPLEVAKSQVQGNYKTELSIWARLKMLVRERGGLRGLYRGILPGTIRSFLANGVSMVVMQWAQKQVTLHGLRK